MKYMFSLFIEEGGFENLSPEQIKAGMATWEAFGLEATEAGVFVAGDGLRNTTDTPLRSRQRREHRVRRPFAETGEAGRLLPLDCRNLDEAIAWEHKTR